jgi:hypothetical protein
VDSLIEGLDCGLIGRLDLDAVAVADTRGHAGVLPSFNCGRSAGSTVPLSRAGDRAG